MNSHKTATTQRFKTTGCTAYVMTIWLCCLVQAAPPEARLPEQHRGFLKTHCFDCHNTETHEGKVDLESLSLRISSVEQAELWQKVLNALNAGEMPPEDSDQPGNAEKTDFLDDLAQTMVVARQALSDSGGRITMRRLNRREYGNTIEHLLGVSVDVESLPQDGGAGTFDTVGTSQFISSDQFEQYLRLGRIAIDEAFDRRSYQAAEPMIFRVEPENVINPENERELKQIEDSYERFTRWQTGVDQAAATPENKQKIAELSKKHPSIKHPIHFYKYANLLEETPDAKDYGFRDAQKAASSNPDWDRAQLAYHKHYAGLPHRDKGTYLKLAHGTGRVDISPGKELPPGKYTIRVRAGVVDGSPPDRHFIEIGYPQRQIPRNRGLEGNPISSHQITGTIEHPTIVETQLEIGVNTPHEFAIQERQPHALKSLWDAHNAMKRENGYGHPPSIWIDWVELEGPLSGTTWKQRREVEEHANAKVGGTYNGYFKRGHDRAQAFLDTGKPQQGIVDVQEAKFRIRQFEQNGPSFRRYLDNPLTQIGSFLTISNVNNEEFIALPPEHPSGWRKTKHIVDTLPPGRYQLRFRIGAVKGTPAARHFVELGAVPEKNQFNHMATFQITGSTDEPQTIEVPIQLSQTGPLKYALREKRDPAGDRARYNAARKKSGHGPPAALWIDWVEWEGPLATSAETSTNMAWWINNESNPTESNPTESARARQIFAGFATEAMRGATAGSDFIDRLVAIFATRRAAGESFDDAIRTPLSVILASPGFLYLNEPGQEEAPRTLTDRELAVRLAYFLWSGPPDEELLQLAQENALGQPKVLRGQVDRMIADARADEFVSGFVHQWLDMERLDFFQFDVKLHRDFDGSTRAAAREEVYRSFAHLFRDSEAGRLGKLLKSDYIIINGLLATYYGIGGVTGDEFRKVNLPADSPRGGLLGMAAIHAMGSDGVNSSPVERGAWVLRHLLNDPPPPAPPNVPQISRLADQVLTTRERLVAHQEEAQCASCHRKIDPIGFGLENWGAAGKWRSTDTDGVGKLKKTWKIDASGAFHQGPAFDDYQELRDLIAEREEDFARGFTEHLIEYALGRPYGFTDAELANQVINSAKTKQFALSEFVHSLVQSKEFQTK